MSGVALVYWMSLYICFILFFLQYFLKLIKLNVFGKKTTLKKILLTPEVLLLKKHDILYCSGLQLVVLMTLKLQDIALTQTFFFCLVFSLQFLIIVFFFMSLLKFVTVSLKDVHTVFLTLVLLYFCINLFIVVTNFITLLLMIELIGTLYYFFLLTRCTQTLTTFVKYKNLLSLYLWASFFVLFLFVVLISLIVFYCGTLNFLELSYFFLKLPAAIWHLLFIIIGWKVGSAGFQFFKLELYQVLPMFSLFVFSFTTLFFNFLIFSYIIHVFWPIFFYNKALYLTYILVLNLFLIYKAQENLLFYYFLGYSAINTWTVIFLFSLIKCFEIYYKSAIPIL